MAIKCLANFSCDRGPNKAIAVYHHGRPPHAPASRLDYCRASSGPLSPAPMLHATSDTKVIFWSTCHAGELKCLAFNSFQVCVAICWEPEKDG